MNDLHYERVIRAPVAEVFAAFTSPGGQEAFYGQDDPGWIVRSECDLRPGGIWTVDFGPSSSELYRHRHVFRVLDPPRRIVLDSTETRLDGARLEIEIEFTFEERAGETVMTMFQRGFPTVELRDEHVRGLPNAFARLQRYLGGT